jgi:hypothetical protein
MGVLDGRTRWAYSILGSRASASGEPPTLLSILTKSLLSSLSSPTGLPLASMLLSCSCPSSPRRQGGTSRGVAASAEVISALAASPLSLMTESLLSPLSSPTGLPLSSTLLSCSCPHNPRRQGGTSRGVATSAESISALAASLLSIMSKSLLSPLSSPTGSPLSSS